MSPFADALNTLCLSQADAAQLLPHDGKPVSVSMIKDWARGKSRVPRGVWHQLSEMFEAVEQAADDIIADQAELDGGEALTQHTVLAATIPLPHHRLRAAAGARAMLVLGPDLIEIVREQRIDADA